eukprot:XP_011673528.1 PREDICTED: nuclear pore complex protein Nup133 [Strongylocentrotus purpuratus]
MQSFQVIEETPQYCVETFGPSLPVLITEVLLQADRSANISVKLDNSGWACLVCDRRLFIWRYKQTQAARIGLCYQLALPATELCHRADLICLIPTGGGSSGADSQMVSVLAVSPEGVVRYWPTAHREIAYSERSLELGGQECFTLTAFGKHQCILATTTNQLMMISVSPSTMQSQVEVHTLKSSQGMIARVSSFLFGAQKDETSGLRRVLAGSAESAGYPLYILQDSILQKWFISGPGQEQVVYEKQLDGLFKQQFQREMGASSMENIKVWLLDIQLISNIAVILAGAVNTSSPNQRIKIAIATLKVQVDTDTPTKLESFVVASTPPQDSDDEGALDKHLLLANPGGPHCYIYSQHSIVCCSGLFDQMPSFQEVGFSKAGDSIRGAGCFDGQAIFFSSNHGVITVNTSQSEMPSFIMDDSRTGQTSRLEHRIHITGFEHRTKRQSMQQQSMQQQSMQQQSMQQSSFTTPSARSRPFQVMSASRSRPDTSILETTGDLEEDKTNGLKMAFLHSCKHDMNKAENLVQDLFLQDTFERGKTNSSLDQAVAKLSRELIDDFPASDPRWAESLPQDSVASTGSLILLHQLEDKMKAHEHLVKFIKDVGIWDMLHSVIVRDLPQTTHNLLSEHAEKLSAARALCNKHVKFQGLIDTAVCRALRKRKQDAVPSGLTPRDIFYREVSKMEDIVEALMEEEQDLLSSGLTPQDTVSLISSINTIIQSVLQEAWHLHQSRSLVYQSHNEASGTSLPFIPWIASSGPRGIRMQLVQQHNLTVGRAVANAEDAQSRSGLFQQLQSITDLLLEGYIAQLESSMQADGEDSVQYAELEQRYTQERTTLISPFLEHRQFERAAVLAEKYCDFGILVELCESGTGRKDRLQYYMDQFSNKGFSDFVFKYYIDRGQRGKLLTHFAHRPELSEFLQPHDHLGWLQDIHTNNYSQVSQRGKLLTHFAHRPELSEFLQPHDHLGWLQDIHTNNYSQVSKMEAFVRLDGESRIFYRVDLPQDTVSLSLAINPSFKECPPGSTSAPHQSSLSFYQFLTREPAGASCGIQMHIVIYYPIFNFTCTSVINGHSVLSFPSTASSGPRGIRMQLVQQHNLTVGRAVANAEDAQSRSGLFQQLQSITDLLLEGYIAQLESSMQADGEDSVQYAELEQRYTQERTTLISPFLEHRQFERAAVLAEKYCDFGILVELCESGTGRKDRLQYYMDQFSNKGFSDFVFKYYIDRGQRGKLLTHFAHRPELSEFLQPHDHLGWLQDIHTNNYSQAQDTLRKLATRESFSVSKKKTLLSLGKLAALASDNDHQREIGEINAELDVITHHEQLPRELIQKLNLNGDDLPCMTPQQLIELYISERNTNSNEYDFKKALDLLQYLHKEGSLYTDLMVRIWCRAILRDEWNEMQGVDPWDYIKDSIFFKTAAKALQEGLDLTECLPDPDTLMQHYELQGMRDNTRFEYLLRTGFEQIGRSLAAAE